MLRTALMIVREEELPPEGEEQVLIGKILSVDGTMLMVATETGDRCIEAADAVVLFIIESEGDFELIKATLDDLPDNATIVAYGMEGDRRLLRGRRHRVARTARRRRR